MFQDEARIGQKGRVCHRWYTRGKRPPGRADQRYTFAYIFAAAEPGTDNAFALVMPEVSTHAMQIYLDKLSATVAIDEHLLLVLDQAGWHGANDLKVPANITLEPLPPRSPELNPVERLWLYLKERFLSHRLLDDYDAIVTAACNAWNRLAAEAGPFRSRIYVDTGPIVERAYAAAAGLGAWGKNTCLLDPEHGSWFFLGEVVTDLELAADAPRTDMCGSCTACLDACPTGALPAAYVLDATRCISYLTIEVKGAIPEDRREGIGRHVFGCDICQDVCPWNRRRRHRGTAAFEPRPGLQAPDLAELAGLDDEAFRERFRKNPVKRAKRRGLLRNVAVALGNAGDAVRRPVLERLARDEDPVVREHAAWALRNLDLPKPDKKKGGVAAPPG